MMESFRGRGPAILAGGITAAVAVVAVVLLTGGDGDPQEASSAAPTAPSGEKATQGAKEPASSESGEPAEKNSSAPNEGETELTAKEVRKKLKVVPLDQRRKFAEAAVLAILRSYGYRSATVALANNGALVKVSIPPSDACAAEAAKIPEIKRRILEVVIFASNVWLGVFGSDDLAAYVSAHCKPLKPPVASGRLLWSASGTGLRSSEQFQVSGNRFTVSYANNSGELEIYVTRGQELIEPAIKSEKRETGSQTYPGPGTFRVTVSGSGSWEVSVYDGT
ncbi:MAG: hypothetical protein ACRDL6_01880 [Solirubrobacterales bacterium]